MTDREQRFKSKDDIKKHLERNKSRIKTEAQSLARKLSISQRDKRA